MLKFGLIAGYSRALSIVLHFFYLLHDLRWPAGLGPLTTRASRGPPTYINCSCPATKRGLLIAREPWVYFAGQVHSLFEECAFVRWLTQKYELFCSLSSLFPQEESSETNTQMRVRRATLRQPPSASHPAHAPSQIHKAPNLRKTTKQFTFLP